MSDQLPHKKSSIGVLKSQYTRETMYSSHKDGPAGVPAPRSPDHEEAPHGCIDGWVYLGFEGEDVNGEHVEEIERVPCKRCRA